MGTYFFCSLLRFLIFLTVSDLKTSKSACDVGTKACHEANISALTEKRLRQDRNFVQEFLIESSGGEILSCALVIKVSFNHFFIFQPSVIYLFREFLVERAKILRVFYGKGRK